MSVCRLSAIFAVLVLAVDCADTTPPPVDIVDTAGDPVVGEPMDTIAFGSCAFQWDGQLVWRAVTASGADLYLSLDSLQ